MKEVYFKLHFGLLMHHHGPRCEAESPQKPHHTFKWLLQVLMNWVDFQNLFIIHLPQITWD